MIASVWNRNGATSLIRVFLALVLPEDLPAALDSRSFDVVVHMGPFRPRPRQMWIFWFVLIIMLSEQILNYCACRGARLIYASSAATYGDGSLGFADDESLQSLGALRPLNAYGWSKALFDQLVIRRKLQDRPLPPQWVGLKFFNVFGPNEYHKGEMRSVVHKVHGQIRSGQPVTLFKSYRDGIPDGGQLRDFIYVEDCVSVVEWLLERSDVCGIFNVGTGKARSSMILRLQFIQL